MKLPGWDKPRAKTSKWSKDMLENDWNGSATWQTRRQSNKTGFLVFAGTITVPKKEELEKKGRIVRRLPYCTKVLARGTKWST